MLFSPEHIDMIDREEKTVSRRMWKRKMVKVGGIYATQTKRYQKKSEARVFIEVTGLYEQPLREMTEEDCLKEGGYTPEQFKQVWINIYGEWNDDDVPWVVEFKKV